MKFGVVVFPGSNCDRDVAYVVQDLLGQQLHWIWHTEQDLGGVDVVVIPGGFSYGDYLRCGALARLSPVMEAVCAFARGGGMVLGICNGFQVLTEAGLLPGALIRNQKLHFTCDRVHLRVERQDLPWVQDYRVGEVITLPIAHGEGCYYADPTTLRQLEDQGQVLLRYCSASGALNENPNGSLNGIAGLCNAAGNVLGMMPHPERAADPLTGGTAGRRLFAGLLAASP